MYDSLVKNVLIIGGGVIGLSIARELHKRGVRQIILVEKGTCGDEASWAAGGMLGPQAEADEGGMFFEMCSDSRDLYREFAAELLNETGIDIELDLSGTLYLAFTDEDVSKIRNRFQWQQKLGLAVENLSAEAARQAEPFISPNVREALFFPNDWQVDNRKLLSALKRYAEINDIEIRENSRVERLIVDNKKVIGAETDNVRIISGQTVLATGAWTSLIKLGVAEIPFTVEPVRGQMITFQTTGRLFQQVIYSRSGYLVPRMDGRILAGSTSENAGFDKSLTESAARELRYMASEIAPSTARLPISDHWSGLRPCATDGMPVIGGLGDVNGLFIATAHFRNGILLAPLTARMTAASLAGSIDCRYSETFGPDRFRPRGIS